MSIGFSFTKSPSELVEYFKAKYPELHFDYDEIMHEAHHKSFTVAKVTKLDLLTDIQESLKDAMDKGKGFEQWKKELKPTLVQKGWYGKTEVINPATGEVKEIVVGAKRLKNIYNTNMRVAYAKGNYESQMQNDGEYFRYSSLLEGNRRLAHKQIHGLILPKNDPFWDKNYPPNGWGCACKVRVYTIEELESRGWKASTIKPNNVASPDWAFNPGITDNAKKIYEEKIQALRCKESNAKSKDAKCGFIEEAKKEQSQTLEYLAQNVILFEAVKELFTVKDKKIELCKSDIFGKEKIVILSSDTVQSHLKREEITAFDYSLVPNILDGRAFKQKENTYVVIQKYGKYYRVALKEVKDKDEIFVVSLIGSNSQSDYKRWIRELDKFEEIKNNKR
jgi:SPP1 gp7 family putative phage head morphogenesis protein